MRRSIGNDGALDDLILAGRKIGAIKAYRLATGASLIAARDAIDARTAALRAAGRQPLPHRLSFGDYVRIAFILGIIGLALAALFGLITVDLLDFWRILTHPQSHR